MTHQQLSKLRLIAHDDFHALGLDFGNQAGPDDDDSFAWDVIFFQGF